MSARKPQRNPWGDLIAPVAPRAIPITARASARAPDPGTAQAPAGGDGSEPQAESAADIGPIRAEANELVLIAPDGLLSDALTRSLALLDPGMRVIRQTGSRAAEALARARLILLDLDVHGSEALLASLRAETTTPIVALVASPDHPAVEACLAKGAVACVAKTSPEATVLERLARVLAEHATRPAARAQIDQRLRGESQQDRAARPYGLTPSELDVLRLLAEGLTNLQIARRRNCTEGTVKVHLDKVYRKLGVENRTQAILVAKRTVAIGDLQIQHLDQDGFRLEWLLPFTETEVRKPGDVLFHKGEPGDALYYIQRGRVVLVELGVQLSDGCVLGEIGIFSPGHQRTSTAKCDAETRLFRLGAEQARRLYIENPQFAYHVLRLISGRLIADQQRHGHTVH
jgi:DNA-binding NarL/FixJ family response regulator